MGKRRSRLRRHLDARGPGDWPCPCCGYRTLHEGPGDYDLCPVCCWEDAGEQLRWPTLTDGPNGISLIEAQRNFVEIGASHPESLADVRKPQPGEERDPDWRPIDPSLDDFESGPQDPQNLPWPPAEELYWWRPNYFRRPENQRPGPAPRRPPSNEAEQMMARILAAAPETAAIDIDMRSRWEEPAPLAFCSELVPFVVEAVQRGDADVALRIVHELNAGLTSGDDFAATCVSVGFLEPQYEWSDDADEWPPRERLGFRGEGMAAFVDTWPPEIKAEFRRQVAHQEKMLRTEKRFWRPQPDGAWKVTLRWKLRHPILWWRMRHGGSHLAG